MININNIILYPKFILYLHLSLLLTTLTMFSLNLIISKLFLLFYYSFWQFDHLQQIINQQIFPFNYQIHFFNTPNQFQYQLIFFTHPPL